MVLDYDLVERNMMLVLSHLQQERIAGVYTTHSELALTQCRNYPVRTCLPCNCINSYIAQWLVFAFHNLTRGGLTDC